ncbi:MAG: molybdate ABC transporter permease subunit, partial [Casimicrobiaceae bacterium]
MDGPALVLSLQLAAATVALLLPVGIIVARALAWRRFTGRRWVEAALALPLVLPPTVLGFYLLVAFGAGSPLGQAFEALTGSTLAFSFAGLLVASLVVNLPFA